MTTSSSIKVKAALRIEIGNQGKRIAAIYARSTDLSSAESSAVIKELSKLSEAERQEVLSKLRDLVHRDEEIAGCNHPAAEGAAPLNRLAETGAPYRGVDLKTRGIGKAQAGDLRTRLKTFAEDWDRPEASIYDEDPAR